MSRNRLDCSESSLTVNYFHYYDYLLERAPKNSHLCLNTPHNIGFPCLPQISVDIWAHYTRFHTAGGYSRYL